MANRKDVARIRQVLTKGLSHLNKPTRVVVQKSGVGDNLHVHVLSDSFSRWSLTKRHEFVEALLQRELPCETLLKVSALFVLTPKEADGSFPFSPETGENADNANREL